MQSQQCWAILECQEGDFWYPEKQVPSLWRLSDISWGWIIPSMLLFGEESTQTLAAAASAHKQPHIFSSRCGRQDRNLPLQSILFHFITLSSSRVLQTLRGPFKTSADASLINQICPSWLLGRCPILLLRAAWRLHPHDASPKSARGEIS